MATRETVTEAAEAVQPDRIMRRAARALALEELRAWLTGDVHLRRVPADDGGYLDVADVELFLPASVAKSACIRVYLDDGACYLEVES